MKKISFLLHPKFLILISLVLIFIGGFEAILFGYARFINGGFLYLESAMDVLSVGFILFWASTISYFFWMKYKLFRVRLGLFCISFTIFMRLFWELLWITGSYYPAVYTSWAVLNNRMLTLPANGQLVNEAFPTLDYLTEAIKHYTFTLSTFSIFFFVLIIIGLSMLIDIMTKKHAAAF